MGRIAVRTTLGCLMLASSIVPAARGQSYTISTVAGGGVPSNVQGKSASFGWAEPRFLTADPAGNVYFVDQNAILRWDAASGLVTLVAGSAATGYSGDGGPAVSALLNAPQGLAMDSSGALYVADAGNYAIRKIYQGVITTVAGNGAQGTSCANGSALGTGLNLPEGLAVDSSGNLYISEVNLNCVRKVSNGQITTVAGTGTAGFRGDGGPATSALLSSPAGVAVDSSGNLYIAESFNDRIREVAAGTGIITTVAGGSTCGNCYTGIATSVSLSVNGGLAVDSSGNLYISNGYNVSKVSNGSLSIFAGSAIHAGFSGDGGPPSAALLGSPEAIALDAAGHLYIADENNFRIREVSSGTISTIVGNGSVGDNGPATQAQLYSTGFIALDSADNLYIGDPTMSTVRKVAAADGTITTYASTFGEVDGIAVDSAGNLFVADSAADRIWKFSNGSRSVYAGTGQLGYSPNMAAADAKMWGPFGLAADSTGNLYFSDTTQAPGSPADLSTSRPNDSYIDEISNGNLNTIGGDGPGGYNGDGQPGLNTAFNSPAGVAVDKVGNVFVSDAANYRIREISNTGTVTTVAGNGVQGYAGDNGPAADAELNLVRRGYPFINSASGVAVDQAGNIYIADTLNYRVRKVTASTGIITTIAGTGTSGYSGDNGPATSAELSFPRGIAVDAAGNVFVADGLRVRELTPSAATACTYTVSSTSLSSSASGGNVTVNVQTAANCSWTVSGLPSWITISGAASGTGPGSATISVAANTGAVRSATITIAGQAITITQSGAAVGPAIALVVNAESGAPVVAPNTWVEINGSDLAPAGDSRTWAASDFVGGQMPTNLDGVSVTVNGAPAYIYYISPTQVDVLTPPGALPASVGVVLTNGAASSAAFPIAAQAESLSFFVFNGGPYVAATHANGNLIGPATLYSGLSTPATSGETIVIYANGFGPTSMPVTAGAETQSGTLSPLPVVTIGGMAATVTFAGLVAPGEFQFNVVVPAGLTAGDQPITASYAGSSTQSGTLLTIQ